MALESLQNVQQVNPYLQQATPVNPQLSQQKQGLPSVFELAKENEELKKENAQLMQSLNKTPADKQEGLASLAKQKAEYSQIEKELNRLQGTKGNLALTS